MDVCVYVCVFAWYVRYHNRNLGTQQTYSTDKQTDRQTGKQTDRHTQRHDVGLSCHMKSDRGYN